MNINKKELLRCIGVSLVTSAMFTAGKHIGKEYGRTEMYSRMMKHILRATSKSCEYKMPVEDRKLAFEEVGKAAIYRAMISLKAEAEKERPW